MKLALSVAVVFSKIVIINLVGEIIHRNLIQHCTTKR